MYAVEAQAPPVPGSPQTDVSDWDPEESETSSVSIFTADTGAAVSTVAEGPRARGPAEAAGRLARRGRSEAVRALRPLPAVSAESREGLRAERLPSDRPADGAGGRVPGALLPPSARAGVLVSDREGGEGELGVSHLLLPRVSTAAPAATPGAETVADVGAPAAGAGGGEDRTPRGLLPAEPGSGGAGTAAVCGAGAGAGGWLAPPAEARVPPGAPP